MQDNHIQEIKRIHRKIKPEIYKRESEFKNIWANASNKELFIELAFCIFTPQSGARICWKAVCNLLEKDLLFDGGFDRLSNELNIVRFRNNKARYLIEAREKFLSGDRSLREYLEGHDSVFEKRDWIFNNVKGIGYKEASHYLRNIGFGKDIAILDRHILRNMVLFRLIEEIPKSIGRKQYMDLENKLRDFSNKVKIHLSHLDFVLWYKETGDIFK